MAIDEYMDPARAVNLLASHLRDGTLVLFVGAGTSRGMGLPKWVEFVNQLRKDIGLSLLPDTPTPTADELQKAADEVELQCGGQTDEYFQLLKKHLYQNIERLSSNVLKNELLTAIGALLMGSKRGNIRRVVSFNFDSMLEWFLSLYGFVVRVTHQLPQLEGSEDVRIYHPHGFLPHPTLSLENSTIVILSLYSVNKRLGTSGDQWYEMVRHQLRSGMCLFVGLSSQTFDDRSLAPLLNTVGEEIKPDRPTGVWLLLKANQVSNLDKRRFVASNVVPLELQDEATITNFLLEICQKAAEGNILTR